MKADAQVAWLPERHEMLLKLFGEKESYRHIARLMSTTFNYPYTVGSIAGRIDRQGMTRSPRPPNPTTRSERRRRAKQEKSLTTGQFLRREYPAPTPGTTPIWELTGCHCKYIGSNNLYCGEPTINDSSWCGFHYAKVFQLKKSPTIATNSRAVNGVEVAPSRCPPSEERAASL